MNITVRHLHRSATRPAKNRMRRALCGREIPSIWEHLAQTKGKRLCGLCQIMREKQEAKWNAS